LSTPETKYFHGLRKIFFSVIILCMTPEEFKHTIAKIGWSQDRAAEVLDQLSKATVENWATGRSRVNGAAVALLEFLIARPEHIPWFEARRPRQWQRVRKRVLHPANANMESKANAD
jgi:hypothetical protein